MKFINNVFVNICIHKPISLKICVYKRNKFNLIIAENYFHVNVLHLDLLLDKLQNLLTKIKVYIHIYTEYYQNRLIILDEL